MSIQPALFALPPAPPAASLKARGAVFTRQAVVDFMLDLVGYTPDRPLHRLRLLEPSFGGGRFVVAAAGRLVAAWRAAAAPGDDSALDGAIRAVEVDPATFDAFRVELPRSLRRAGLPELSAQRIARSWLVNEDFLFGGSDGEFDFIVGNPPYVRQENMPPGTLARCRAEFATMVGRADLYVPFFERGLGLLAPGGRLSFICADAWTKNDYGRELRRLVAGRFALRTYVDMYGVDAFESEVGAYPSVTVIERGAPGPVAIARATSADAVHLAALARSLGRAAPRAHSETAAPRATSEAAGSRGSERERADGIVLGGEAGVEDGTGGEVAHPGRGGGPWLL
ncbi:MAG: Eco57I restriction-modification methylase domain-containing protein, partial [Bifidobacteriaceae bacterium]|nr:Eco57I restriction-modification methylase domain-containing protein [Bifidobacteriaceae bacterium]